MLIDYRDLEDDTFTEVVKECVIREMQDDSIVDVNKAVEEAVRLIKKGSLLLMYSELNETIGLVRADDFKKNQAN